MPARRYSYTVFADDGQHATMQYMGPSERQAAFAFYRAARNAAPGVTVLMRRSGELHLRVRVLETDPGANRSSDAPNDHHTA